MEHLKAIEVPMQAEAYPIVEPTFAMRVIKVYDDLLWDLCANCACGGYVKLICKGPAGEAVGVRCDRCPLTYTVRWNLPQE